MRLAIRHLTRFAYDPPADRCAMRLRLYPSTFAAQKVKAWKVTVNGAAVPALLTTGFGDKEAIWSCEGPSELVEIEASGEVETSDVAGFVKNLKEAARPGVFLRTTPLTEADARIETLAKSVSGASALEKMHALCGAVRDAMDAKPASERHLSAAQALKAGEGSGADHSHVFVSAARVLGVPARFIVGYLLAEEESSGSKPAETHAWAEAYMSELGWVGFDPMSRLCPTERYVRLASGLDSADGAPVRGGAGGRAQETVSASVDIAEAVSQSQSQTQQ
jgi:transglutaminase-like putative cysteine protease